MFTITEFRAGGDGSRGELHESRFGVDSVLVSVLARRGGCGDVVLLNDVVREFGYFPLFWVLYLDTVYCEVMLLLE